uniref:Uncharacterized protein n=1 Tax=Peronospora matthiolae TaxID=2874970 RepID=A0AAV1UA64_9STRA
MHDVRAFSHLDTEKLSLEANDDYEMSRCDMVLDDGGAGIPGTLGIIEVGWSAGARLNQDSHGARMQQ